MRAVERGRGDALPVDDKAMHGARHELAGQGLRLELSAAAGLAGLRSLPDTRRIDRPVVCVTMSGGPEDRSVG